MTYYSWSNIRYGGTVDKDGNIDHKVAKHGDKVTADSLGISKDEFQGLIDSGVVRDIPCPEVPMGSTPRKAMIVAAQKQMEEATKPRKSAAPAKEESASKSE